MNCYLSDLEERLCACGEPTGSPVLDTCEAHDAPCPVCLNGSVVSDTCDYCGERHCCTCDTCGAREVQS